LWPPSPKGITQMVNERRQVHNSQRMFFAEVNIHRDFEPLLDNPEMTVELNTREYTVTLTFDQPAPLEAKGTWTAYVMPATMGPLPGTPGSPASIDIYSKKKEFALTSAQFVQKRAAWMIGDWLRMWWTTRWWAGPVKWPFLRTATKSSILSRMPATNQRLRCGCRATTAN